MTELTLTLTSQPDVAVLAQLGDNLSAVNAGDVGPSGRQEIAVLMHEADALVAGLSGYTAWGWLYVQWLWVAEGQRRQGLAGRMLAAAETEASGRGCHGAYIDTFSPTALQVYQKAGYAIFGTLPDFPTGRTRSFLAKALI